MKRAVLALALVGCGGAVVAKDAGHGVEQAEVAAWLSSADGAARLHVPPSYTPALAHLGMSLSVARRQGGAWVGAISWARDDFVDVDLDALKDSMISGMSGATRMREVERHRIEIGAHPADEILMEGVSTGMRMAHRVYLVEGTTHLHLVVGAYLEVESDTLGEEVRALMATFEEVPLAERENASQPEVVLGEYVRAGAHAVRLRLPEGWSGVDLGVEAADIQLQHMDQQLVFTTAPRDPSKSLDEIARAVTNSYIEGGLEKLSGPHPIDTEAGKGVYMTIGGVVAGRQLVYLVAVVVGANNVHSLAGWTLRSRFATTKEVLLRVVETIDEI